MTSTEPTTGVGQEPPGASEGATRSRRRRRLLSVVASVVLVVAVFWGVLPQVADFRDVWAAITDMTWLETASLVALAAWNLATYAFVTMAALAGIGFWRAFAVGQSSTAVATALPAGSAVGVGVTYSMFASYGRSGGEIALASVLTGIWNNFVKLGLPIVALALLTFSGTADPALMPAGVVGVVVLAAAVVLFALMLRSDALARRVGAGAGRAVDALRRLVRRPQPRDYAAGAVAFRHRTVDLLRSRWGLLTAATVVSHLSLYAVLLVSLRHMGVSEQEVSWTEVLGVFALIRLLTALPITPGGLGIVELGFIGALVVAGGDRAGVVAAVLVFRFLTLIVQIPIGILAYLVWKARASRHRPTTPARYPDPGHPPG